MRLWNFQSPTWHSRLQYTAFWHLLHRKLAPSYTGKEGGGAGVWPRKHTQHRCTQPTHRHTTQDTQHTPLPRRSTRTHGHCPAHTLRQLEHSFSAGGRGKTGVSRSTWQAAGSSTVSLRGAPARRRGTPAAPSTADTPFHPTPRTSRRRMHSLSLVSTSKLSDMVDSTRISIYPNSS